MLVADKLANGEEPKESRLRATHNRYMYRDGVPPPGIFWLLAISHPLARTRDGPSLDGRGTTGRTEDLLETKRGISKATKNYRYKKKESLAFAASRLNVVAFLA